MNAYIILIAINGYIRFYVQFFITNATFLPFNF